MKDVMELLSKRHLNPKAPVLLGTVSGVASTKPRLIIYFDSKVAVSALLLPRAFKWKLTLETVSR